MIPAIALSLLLVLTTIYIHFEVLRLTSVLLPRLGPVGRVRVLAVVLATFSAHIAEVLLYAGAYFAMEHWLSLGHLAGQPTSTLTDYFYYSMTMYTTLGLGDVYPVGHIKLITGVEALNGLVLIGWSTSFTYLAMRDFWPMDPSIDTSGNERT